MLWLIVIILLALMLFGGVGIGTFGSLSFGPLGLFLLILCLLYFSGRLR